MDDRDPWPTRSAPSAIRITGGHVVDPAYPGQRRTELLIAGDRIVDRLPPGSCQQIDAGGRLVVAGAIDMHTHIASRGVALAREIQAHEHALTPSPAQVGQRYIKLGYTTVMDAAVPPRDVELARQTLDAIPYVDAGFLLELGHQRELVQAIARHGTRGGIQRIAQWLEESGAYGIKLVNPGHSDDLDSPLYGTRVTPLRLMEVAAAAVERMGLPHPLHLHAPHLGEPGNVETTIDLLETLDQPVHLAHAQFYAYGRTPGGGRCSAADQLCDWLAHRPDVTADTGCVVFGPAMMITRDRPLALRMQAWTGIEPTLRHGWCIAPLRYDQASPVAGLQWAVGLELVLHNRSLERLALSVDHPNGGSFTDLPGLLRPLMNRELRHRLIADLDPAAGQRTMLAELDRELTLHEALALTRLAPARALGLTDRGHLQPGALADVVITDDLAGEPCTVIKSGRVVVSQGQITDLAAAGHDHGARLSAVG